MNHIVGLSGGKDSTALALRLAEVEPRDYRYICTPTGNELSAMFHHWDKLESLLRAPIIRITNQTLLYWIDKQNALPSNRMRWCTRKLKIEPTIQYVRANSPAILYVGLRADESETERIGICSDDVTSRFPLREWGWGVDDVWDYLDRRGVTIPSRTDCAWCYHQRLGQWRKLWQNEPALYAQGEYLEAKTGHTFRSPTRDTWPAAMKDMRAKFEAGVIPQGDTDQLDLFGHGEVCRECSL